MKLIHRIRHPKKLVIMEHEISVKRELMSEDLDIAEESDGDQPKLEIADQHPDSSKDVIESLLLLGKQAVLGKSSCDEPVSLLRPRSFSIAPSASEANLAFTAFNSRRHSSSGSSESGAKDKGAVVSYYQRMRERNNEASKRCRLKRRMKAVSMENQASMLVGSNKMLKLRIQRLEQIGAALKEGVKKIQSGQCACDLTLNMIKKTNKEFRDADPDSGDQDLTCQQIVSKSRIIRTQPIEGQPMHQLSSLASSCSSEDDLSNFSPSPRPVGRPPANYKTALDVINETIVRTLDSPLNLVKTAVIERRPSRDPLEVLYIKSEPVDTPADSTQQPVCIANTNGASICRGDMINLNKLTCFLDLVSRKVSNDNGSSAMERAIIKSRLKIPFWNADEEAHFICAAHRSSIVQGSDLNTCALCNKKRNTKKVTRMPSQVCMFTITYSMSLEFYTRNGHYLPIGLAVCALCRDKHLKSVDLSNSRLIQNDCVELVLPDSNTSPMAFENVFVSPPLVSQKREAAASPPRSLLKKQRHLSTSNVTSTNGEVVVAKVDPPHSFNNEQVKTVVPVSSSSQPSSCGKNNTGIFAKIGNLNEALQAINPKYQPIGFSITSMDSCSPGVLQDAISATEAAIFTVLSVIAPGQESNLWETVKPTLDKKLSKAVDDKN